MASGPGVSENLEKSGNFVALAKCQGKVREFHKIQKSQGILMQNWEKSGNFNAKLRKVGEFYLRETNIAEVFSEFIQMGTKISHACSYIMHTYGFLSKNKNEFKLWNSLLFWIKKCTVID